MRCACALDFGLPGLTNTLRRQRDRDARRGGRDVAGGEGDETQQEGDSQKYDRICGADSEKQTRERRADLQGRGACPEDADANELCPLTDDQTRNIGRLCAERHANAHFIRALCNGVADHSVQSHGSQKQCRTSQ